MGNWTNTNWYNNTRQYVTLSDSLISCAIRAREFRRGTTQCKAEMKFLRKKYLTALDIFSTLLFG